MKTLCGKVTKELKAEHNVNLAWEHSSITEQYNGLGSLPVILVNGIMRKGLRSESDSVTRFSSLRAISDHSNFNLCVTKRASLCLPTAPDQYTSTSQS